MCAFQRTRCAGVWVCQFVGVFCCVVCVCGRGVRVCMCGGVVVGVWGVMGACVCVCVRVTSGCVGGVGDLQEGH